LIIKILGTGCRKCKELEKSAEVATKELNIDAKIEKVEDIGDIIGYGVMKTPALVIDEEVVSAGKLLSVEELKKLLTR